MRKIVSIDARTGGERGWSAEPSTLGEVSDSVERAVAAFSWLEAQGRERRAFMLELMAQALEANVDELAALADGETALGLPRLKSEVARTSFQLRFLSGVAVEGSYLEASIEHRTKTELGSQPDLRRMNVPIGPVAVFGSSNFPFAFSVPGGDTASALAAGCPVIVKAHSSHPQLSMRISELFGDVLRSLDAPLGVFQIVFGREAGTALVKHPGIRAIGFTGSVHGGRALFDAAAARPDPVPFYGELGSVNPLVVTALAARERAETIAEGIAGSMTIGAGQFCTKPGLFLIPIGPDGDRVVEHIANTLDSVTPAVLLNASITESFVEGVAQVLGDPRITVRHRGKVAERTVEPVLVEIGADAFEGSTQRLLSEEYFGPFGVVVRWSSLRQVSQILLALPAALTGTVHSGKEADPELADITRMLASRSGRLVFDEYPTGVTVAWGMNHGGQYPASTSNSTSVGASSISRWLRPVTYQNAPPSVLPRELDDDTDLPHRVDGALRSAAINQAEAAT
ncbi:aldehyde dehydrogenase (NADP(+)) [soil metagenome]